MFSILKIFIEVCQYDMIASITKGWKLKWLRKEEHEPKKSLPN